MKITEVKIRRLTDHTNVKAIVSVTLDDVFAVHDIKVIQGPQGLFVAMPSRRTHDGTFRDIVHPIHMDLRILITEAVLRQYEQAVDRQQYRPRTSLQPVT